VSDASLEGLALHDALSSTTITFRNKKSTAVLVSVRAFNR
jgi:hypothetical protein